jgi:hypothetical protein
VESPRVVVVVVVVGIVESRTLCGPFLPGPLCARGGVDVDQKFTDITCGLVLLHRNDSMSNIL